ncbi:class I SAM-dependent methyltransferase [Amycolatopsis nigrescens]|uniref:class I SAM-dependent methyltransferase n=1 Tax=Amycolatopsis nigrescens TaxID=381445 RepID=UPI000375B203|nr:class I SAM-dependent methyltransferase [Amycolatopsis nigrescens]
MSNRETGQQPAWPGPAAGWPPGFPRVPGDAWTGKPVDEAALKYEAHGSNSFSRCWDPVIAQALAVMTGPTVVMDYSCGTGLLTDRLLAGTEDSVLLLNVDVSPRYLRVILEKFEDEPRVAMRLLQRVPGTNDRFQSVDEVIGTELTDRGIDLLISTNAIHLYADLSETLETWHKVLKPGGIALVSTGDMTNPDRKAGDWRLHDAVEAVNDIASEMVRTEPLFEKYREKLESDEVMKGYAALRAHAYPEVGTVDKYLRALAGAGLKPLHYFEQLVNVYPDDLVDSLSPYHEVVLGWIGGTRKVEGASPAPGAVRDRLFLLRYCIDKLYAKRDHYQCHFSYFTCRKETTPR